MQRLIAATVFVSTLAFAAASQAASPVTATLAAPVAKEVRLVAGGAVWRCVDTTCTVASATYPELFPSCKIIARQVGAVTALGSAARSLDADRLARCNAK